MQGNISVKEAVERLDKLILSQGITQGIIGLFRIEYLGGSDEHRVKVTFDINRMMYSYYGYAVIDRTKADLTITFYVTEDFGATESKPMTIGLTFKLADLQGPSAEEK